MPCLAEGSRCECEDLGGSDGEHHHRSGTAFVPESIPVDFVVPASIPLPRPRFGQTSEEAPSVTWYGVALDHDVKPPAGQP